VIQTDPSAELTERHVSQQLLPTSSEEEVVRLTRKLASMRDRLESAEFALTHLGAGDQPLEGRLQNLVHAAMAEAQTMRLEARSQIGIIVAEAEQLRAFARQEAESSARQAREEVMKKAEEMLEDANRLRLVAEESAAQVVRAAQAKGEEAEARAADLLRSTELAHSEATRRRSEIEQQVVAARAQAQAFLRSASLEAEARARDLTNLAHQQLADAQRQAEAIISNAEQEARTRLAAASLSLSSEGPGSQQGNSESEDSGFNRVGYGRKFGRPHS
jgi:hypothetical protein